MSRLHDAIAWSGVDATLILFVAFPAGAVAEVSPPSTPAAPMRIRQYDLEDLDRHLSGRSVREYDLVYDQVPEELEQIVMLWIAAAMASGADFAWFGFEGTFHFEHILTTDISDQVFAVGTRNETRLALDDDYRDGPEWAAVLLSIRDGLGL